MHSLSTFVCTEGLYTRGTLLITKTMPIECSHFYSPSHRL